MFSNSLEFNQLDDTLVKIFYKNADCTIQAVGHADTKDVMTLILEFLSKTEAFKVQTTLIACGLKRFLTNYKIAVEGDQRSLSSKEMRIVGFDSKKMLILHDLMKNNPQKLIAFKEGEAINLNALLAKLAPVEASPDAVLSIEPSPEASSVEASPDEALPDEASFQFSPQGQYVAGTLTGTFLVNPAIRYFKDQVNGENENKFFIEYYNEMFTSDALSHLAVALIVPITNKIISTYLGIPEYLLSGNNYLPNFAAAITDSPFAQGLLQSTLIEGAMLAMDGAALLGETLYCQVYSCDNSGAA